MKAIESKPKIAVVGSLNLDLAARVARLPRPGETVSASDMQAICGGKGANQAVVAARMGAIVAMIGRVGNDSFGGQLVAGLKAEGVLVDHVKSTPGCSSGMALINVEESGQNTIVVAAGANGNLTPRDVESAEAAIADCELVLAQLEVPLATVQATIRLAKCRGKRVLLNAAPAPAAGSDIEGLLAVDVLCLNETEAQSLSGVPIDGPADEERAAAKLRQRGAKSVVITLGRRGALICGEDGRCECIAAYEVEAVDATAAGDAFVGALAVMLAEGRTLNDAARFSCAAGALAATRFGAQPSLPSREEVENLVANGMNSVLR